MFKLDSVRLGNLKFLLVLFVISVVLNYIWETAQAPLFVSMDSFRAIGWHCFVASLGDGLLLWVIQGLGWATFGNLRWSSQPGLRQLVFILSTSLAISIVIEWFSVHVLHRWAYTDNMPRIPVLDVGLTPILQMLSLPPIIFFFTHKFLSLPKANVP
jgi:hypothetical protein